MSTVRVFPDFQALSQAAAERIVELARQAIANSGRFSIALSGGSTPRETYKLLAAAPYVDAIDWSRFHVFWGDERCIGPDDARSNYGMAREVWLKHVPVPAENVYRMRGEDDPQQSAVAYAKVLQEYFDLPQVDAAPVPQFDLILLGLGDDAHTASLFPHTAALHEQFRWVVTNQSPAHELPRLTFTAPVINAARHVLFLVAGASKASTIADVLQGNYRPEELPAQLVRPTTGELSWYVEAVAAAMLDRKQLQVSP